MEDEAEDYCRWDRGVVAASRPNGRYDVFCDGDVGKEPLDFRPADIFPLPQDFKGWGPEAAGDNTQDYTAGDAVRVQWVGQWGYYEWVDATIVEACPDGDPGYRYRPLRATGQSGLAFLGPTYRSAVRVTWYT